MPTTKTEDLAGAALDWAVAVAEGKDHSTNKDWGNASVNDLGRCSIAHRNWNGAKYFEPSKNWGHGGPIVEREHIDLRHTFTEGGYRANQSADAVHAKIELPNGATKFDPLKVLWEYGPTPLVAAMRCYVQSKLGESIYVPLHVVEGIQRAAQAAQGGEHG